MGATVELVRGASVTTLSGDGATILGCTYFPATVDAGGDVSVLDPSMTVTETCEVVLEGTAASMRAAAQLLEGLLRAAAQRAERQVGERVYVRYTAASGEAVYRSEIVGGRLMWSDVPLERVVDGGAVLVALMWERRIWWEATADTELALTNSNGTAITGGLTVWNHDDGDAGHDNYVQVGSGYVEGVLPAPVKIELKNTTGGSVQYGNVYVGHNWHDEPLNRVLEAEGGSYSGSTTADGTCSNGFRVGVSILTTMGEVWSFLLLGSDLAAWAGRLVAVMVRFSAIPPGNTYMQVRLEEDSVEIARGAEVLLGGSQLQVVGLVRLPPLLDGLDSFDDVELELWARNIGGGTLNLDYVHLMPTDSLRQLRCLAGLGGNPTMGFGANGKLVDDGLDGVEKVYWEESGGGRSPVWRGKGRPVMVQPGTTQRLYFLHDEQWGILGSDIGDTWSVRVWYRPRRLSV